MKDVSQESCQSSALFSRAEQEFEAGLEKKMSQSVAWQDKLAQTSFFRLDPHGAGSAHHFPHYRLIRKVEDREFAVLPLMKQQVV